MKPLHLSFETAYALMSQVILMAPADLEAAGVMKNDVELIHGDKPWNRAEIPRVCRTLLTICMGNLEVQGIPKCTMPAEHVAAVIASCVSPANHVAACNWMAQEAIAAAKDMAYGDNSPLQVQRVTENQLRGLVALLAGRDKTNLVRLEWARKFQIAINQQDAIED